MRTEATRSTIKFIPFRQQFLTLSFHLHSLILLPSSLPSFTPSLTSLLHSLITPPSLHSLTSTPPPHRTHQRQDVEESHLEVHGNNVVMVLDGPDVLVVVAEEIPIELVLV